MALVTRIIAIVTVLIRMLPLMNENSFLSLARTGNRVSLEKTASRYQINHLCTLLDEPCSHYFSYNVDGLPDEV